MEKDEYPPGYCPVTGTIKRGLSDYDWKRALDAAAADMIRRKREKENKTMTNDTEQRRDELPLQGDNSEQWQKLKNMMLAHLDGVYVFSARDNCDELVTQLIQYLVSAEAKLQARASTQAGAVDASEVVNKLLADITDRRGWRQAWDMFDDDIKQEIRDAFAEIIQPYLRQPTNASEG